MEENTNQAISIIQLVSSSIPVLVGGFLAIGGTLVGTYLNSFINSRVKKKDLKREKIEQLLAAVSKTEHWLDSYKQSVLTNDIKPLGEYPLYSVKYLSSLYANELKNEVSEFSYVAAKLYTLIAEARLGFINSGSIPETFLTGYKPICDDLLSTKSKLLEKAGRVINEM